MPALFVLLVGLLPISAGDTYFETSKNLEIFSDIFRELNIYYVDEINPSQLIRKGIDAMLESLDPYTNFISEAELEGYRFQTTGKYGGIGAIIRKKGDHIAIIEPYEGSPCVEAGLRAGDIILAVDGKSTVGRSVEDISKLLKGQPGTEVKVKIRRPVSDEVMTKTIVRQEIKIDNVPYSGMVSDGIGYIRLDQFTQNAGDNVADALERLESNYPLKGLILDLRGNPGGLLNEAVNVSNIFIDRGKLVVSTKGKVKDWDRDFNTMRKPVDLDIPLVVLTNHGSASASEIVAGTLQDYDRAVILGQLTYGKGLVQQTRDLSYNTKLKLTTAKYYIPSGRCIQAINYSNRDDNGDATRIPDSLKRAFKTSNGRIVYDGGGIEPDLKVEPQKLSLITKALLRQDLIFDYATEYAYQHPEIPDPESFVLTDEDFEGFKNWLKDKDFDYQTSSEQKLEELELKLQEENYFDSVKEDLQHLRASIAHDKSKDLEKYKDEILDQIRLELVTRYYFRPGRIRASFSRDPFLKAAINLLNDTAAYHSLLKPQ